jgi:putative membrane protein
VAVQAKLAACWEENIMFGFIIRVLIGMAGLWLAAFLIHGIQYDSLLALLIAAVILGIANAIVRPILIVLTLPISILTLGLFLFVVNGVVFWLVGQFSPGFHVHGLLNAVLGAIVTGLVSWIGHGLFGFHKAAPRRS